jgi:hypothetical protein
MPDPTEADTREKLIDPALEKAGWDLQDPKQVRFEIPVYDTDPAAWQILQAELRRLRKRHNIPDVKLPGGPTEPCTLAEHYPDGNMPPRIVRFLTDSLLWCDQANDYIERNDPARFHLTPRPPSPPFER